ncbi:MAG TPA: hypothetical protein VFJ84_00725 [Candidatus Saccharimonadales bacterium]|nr:hypothetical protein [Candidatus Saccharimonadales bacterium]
MRRRWIYLLALVFILAAAGAAVLAGKSFKRHGDNTVSTVPAPGKASPQNRACGLFTLNEAKRLIQDAVKSNQNPVYQSSADLEVSSCVYSEQAPSIAAAGRKSATLLIRYPKTPKGALSNRNEFGPLRPATVQAVAGYGDSAYWDPEHGQLNILKSGTWYVLSYGQAAPSARTLSQAKQLADILSGQL